MLSAVVPHSFMGLLNALCPSWIDLKSAVVIVTKSPKLLGCLRRVFLRHQRIFLLSNSLITDSHVIKGLRVAKKSMLPM